MDMVVLCQELGVSSSIKDTRHCTDAPIQGRRCHISSQKKNVSSRKDNSVPSPKEKSLAITWQLSKHCSKMKIEYYKPPKDFHDVKVGLWTNADW